MIDTTNAANDAAHCYRRYAAEVGGGEAKNHAASAGVSGRRGGTHRGLGDARAVRSCHDARREQLTALADQLLDCYMVGRHDQAAKERLVDFVMSEIVTQVAVEDEAFRPIVASAGTRGLLDAMPAAPDHLRRLVREIADNRSEIAVAAATGALVLLMDARAALENAILLPALAGSPSRGATLSTLLGCCGTGDASQGNRSEWWIG